ncbi:MAG: hypothetical protein ABI867_06080 [Kofleriaceae bacterium]
MRDEALLELALGLRSTIARFDDLLDRFAPAPGRQAKIDEVSLIVLGLIAVRDRLHAQLASAADRPVTTRPRAAFPEDLLR